MVIRRAIAVFREAEPHILQKPIVENYIIISLIRMIYTLLRVEVELERITPAGPEVERMDKMRPCKCLPIQDWQEVASKA